MDLEVDLGLRARGEVMAEQKTIFSKEEVKRLKEKMTINKGQLHTILEEFYHDFELKDEMNINSEIWEYINGRFGETVK
jgi:hypothetical protein